MKFHFNNLRLDYQTEYKLIIDIVKNHKKQCQKFEYQFFLNKEYNDIVKEYLIDNQLYEILDFFKKEIDFLVTPKELLLKQKREKARKKRVQDKKEFDELQIMNIKQL